MGKMSQRDTPNVEDVDNNLVSHDRVGGGIEYKDN
jgi:hypothetical protein